MVVMPCSTMATSMVEHALELDEQKESNVNKHMDRAEGFASKRVWHTWLQFGLTLTVSGYKAKVIRAL